MSDITITGEIRRSLQPRHAAFTLLELLLTLSVFAIVASLTLPGLALLLGDRSLARAGDQTAIEMNRVRVDAMRQGRVLVIQAEIMGNTLRRKPFFSANDATEALDQTGSQSSLLTGATQGTMTEIHVEQDAETLIVLPESVQIQTVSVASSARDSQMSLPNIATSSNAAAATNGHWSSPVFFYPDGTTSTAAVTISVEGVGRVIVRLRGITGEATASEVLGE